MLNRITPPDFKPIEHISLITPGHVKLDNGCNLFWFSAGEQELVRIEWIFNNLTFDPQKPLLNNAVNTLLNDGTAKLTGAQIADAIDYYGAFLEIEYGFERSNVTLFTLSKHLHHTLPVIYDILTNSAFPERELQTYIRNQQQKLQVSLQKNDFVARRVFNRETFGDSIFGLKPEPADYARLQQADLLTHFKQMYQPANCTIIIAGKVDDNILKTLTDFFDKDWTNSSTAQTTQQAVLSSGGLFTLVDKPAALQSAIRLGTATIARTHADYPALQIVNTILGGYFGSRLMANIREDKGYTYGIGSATVSFKDFGSLFIATEVGSDVTRQTMDEIQKEIRILQTEPVSDDELVLVKNYMLGSLLGSLENILAHADKFKNVYFSGLDFSYYDRFTEVVSNISADDVLKLANRYFDFEKMTKVIVGKY